jgi:cell division protein ZipA
LGAELRWILLILSLPLLAGIWWWTARRSAQTPGNAELRESVPPIEPRYSEPLEDIRPEPRDWGVPPFEPLDIRTAEFDQVPVFDGPMMVHPDLAGPAARSTVPVRPGMTATTVGDSGDHLDGAAPQVRDAEPPVPDAAERQRIVTIRICAVGDSRWAGERLMAALELHGLAFGNYQVFHRRHTDGRSLFCVASLIEPGTFDIDEMAHQEFRGVTLFAVLPGPAAPLATMDELFGTARGLAEELSGMLQDSKGMPLSPQRAAALREDIARFQASLSGN